MSSDPHGDQAVYLIKKKLINFIPRGSVRYGTDKHGNFTAIQLVKASDLSKPVQNREPVGIQRFYDRDIKGRGDNKDFTWGSKKGGACHLLGEIDKDYAGLLPVCEGYADGVVAYYRKQVPVIVALDAGNLNAIAQEAKAQFLKSQVLVICDNDAHKYKKGVDNGGVLKGVEAATKSGGKYVIPDFSGYEPSGEPKDLWDLWQLGGDKAVDDLLDSPQDAPSNWHEFRLNYIGLKSFWKEVDRVVKFRYRLGNPQKAVKAVLEFSKAHLKKLGLSQQELVDYVCQR
ncbi:MAG: hypothetical protein ABFS56_19390 [Pseudomonadota bacterium]